MLTRNVYNKINILSLVLIALYLLMLSYSLNLLSWGDDAYFLSVAESENPFKWWLNRYLNWSGRITIDLLMVMTIASEWFWRIFIPGSILLMAYSIIRITSSEVSFTKIAIVIFLFIISPNKIMAESFYWVTGFYNYLLPTALALFCFSELHKPSGKKTLLFFSFLSVFIFSYQEQVVILFLIALVFSLYKEATFEKKVVLSICVLNSLLLFFSPGNSSRTLGSIYMYFPNYSDFGFLEKSFLGLDKLYQAFFMSDSWTVFLLILSIVIFSVNKKKLSLAEIISNSICFFYISFFILEYQLGADLSKGIVGLEYKGGVSSEVILNGYVYLGYFFMLIVMSSAVTLMLGLLSKFESSKLVILTLFLGVLSILMLGFSPTVYASSFRVQMIFEVSLVMAIMFIFDESKAFRKNTYI